VGQWIRAALLIAFTTSAGIFQTHTRASAADGPIKIGMVQSMFRDVQPAVIYAVARPFRTLMERQTGLSGDFDICPDCTSMAKKLHDRKLEVGVLHGHEYAWIKAKFPEIEPITIAQPQGGIVQAFIVVAADSQAKRPADLEGESLLIPRGSKGHIFVYLDKIRTGLPKTALKTAPKNGLTPEEALNAVSNGEHAAAIVDAANYASYAQLQPGAAKRLRVLAQSERFPPSVLLTRKGTLAAATLEKLREGLTTAHKTSTYKPLLMMWNLKGFDSVPVDYNAQLDLCLKNYPMPLPAPAVPVKME
jgi:ABC-type phosphate/phosphonate transport system substrate-binding protein